MTKYTTVQGDMWDGIAYTQLGSTVHTDLLMRSNQDKLDYYIFPAGVELNIPDVQPEQAEDSLPPWKRVSR